MPKIPTNPRFRNLTGLKFNRWKVVAYAGVKAHKHQAWKCVCECGTRAVVIGGNLTRNLSKSCGCYDSEVTAARNVANSKHGGCGGPEYEAWHAMIQRCTNPKARGYHSYGGRGIGVCGRWRNFSNFFDDMGPRPSALHSIDRYPNNNGNYEPSNCRWATKLQQDRNKRTNRLVTFGGITLCVTEWAERTGIHKHTLFSRLRKGVPIERLFAPVRK